tara:strand:+ start:202 stop:399 length:198 start_codon:yes stop_codon:yes gene_type:complete
MEEQKIKSKEEFNNKLFEMLTLDELKLINERIYSNEAHIEYWKSYHMEEYDYCIDYLIENRKLLQ